MGFFGSDKTGDTEKNTSENKNVSPVVAIIIGLAIVVSLTPIILPVFIVCIIAGERRKIRLSRWLTAAGTTAVLSIVCAGFSFSRWGGWFLSAPAALWGGWIPDDLAVPLLPALAEKYADTSVGMLWLQHVLVAVPSGLLLISLWWWWRSYALRILGENEGAKYSNMRPVGWMDRRRAQRNEMAVRSGEWSHRNPGSIAVGIGIYGHVASVTVDFLKKAIAVVGTSRSGKTRMANSLAAQQVHEMLGGHLTLDYKGGDDVARAKAELAHKMGVPFLHFKLMSRTGGGYSPPHPYAPSRPAHYDPFQRGNGASKAAMLLNSVPRDGDAAVYERKASEAVKLAYDIAALTGFDQKKTSSGAPLSGLSILAQLLEDDELTNAGEGVTKEQVLQAHPYLSDAAAESKVRNIHSRIASFKVELKRSNSTLSGALEDVRSTVASYINDSAAGPFLSPGSIPSLRIDLVRTILRNEIVVFSLPAQEYPEMAAMIGTMVLLDLQNAVATLRDKRGVLATRYDNAGEDRPGGPDGTPWNPLVVQLEEVGSVKSSAAAEAMLGLFNKSADVGIRPILSTQSLADIEAVDGSGVWLRQLTAQLDHLMSFQLSESQDSEKIAAFSGMVEKKLPTESNSVENNRTGLFRTATAVNDLRSQPKELNRIGVGEALSLDRSKGEFLWVSKTPRLTAVHTTGGEGPNNWFERLAIAPVHEKPQDWDPFADAEMVEQCREDQRIVFNELLDDLAHDLVLHQVLDTSKEAIEVERTAPIGEASTTLATQVVATESAVAPDNQNDSVIAAVLDEDEEGETPKRVSQSPVEDPSDMTAKDNEEDLELDSYPEEPPTFGSVDDGNGPF